MWKRNPVEGYYNILALVYPNQGRRYYAEGCMALR
jgi:hypothetical protein